MVINKYTLRYKRWIKYYNLWHGFLSNCTIPYKHVAGILSYGWDGEVIVCAGNNSSASRRCPVFILFFTVAGRYKYSISCRYPAAIKFEWTRAVLVWSSHCAAAVAAAEAAARTTVISTDSLCKCGSNVAGILMRFLYVSIFEWGKPDVKTIPEISWT